MRIFFDALWSPAGKGLTFWPSFVMSNYEFVTFAVGILGQMWCLIVSSKAVILLWVLCLCLMSAMLSYLFLVVNCWEMADLLVLLCTMFSCAFVIFPHMMSWVRCGI